MQITITCRGTIEHTEVLDAHIKQKLQKVIHFLSFDQEPQSIAIVLDGHPNHAHNEVHIRVSSPLHHRVAHREGEQLYVILDEVMDIIYRDLCKDKEERETLRKNAGPHRP